MSGETRETESLEEPGAAVSRASWAGAPAGLLRGLRGRGVAAGAETRVVHTRATVPGECLGAEAGNGEALMVRPGWPSEDTRGSRAPLLTPLAMRVHRRTYAAPTRNALCCPVRGWGGTGSEARLGSPYNSTGGAATEGGPSREWR
ncbi:hypothetical protein NDU88_007957 [Pleurodeles waltl]|uniref:Uncharacterized protein n=1 Tax=Pleurodeles waltl TaxID=8319 RepID=A0AAV7PVC3_PLEWA|nr:hypothetical protein NDU88_007957 [Pleurodeles waltl]